MTKRLLLLLAVCLAFAVKAEAQLASGPRVGVIVATFTGYPTASATTTQARAVLFTDVRSVTAIYLEHSYGQLVLSGEVYGPYALPITVGSTCPWNTWITAAKQRAALDGFDPSAYQALVFALPKVTSCPGRAWTSGNQVLVLSGFDAGTVGHELGHAFGLNHAASWVCRQLGTDGVSRQVTLSGTCTANEYGDFAMMGNTGPFHLNAFHKAALGLLPAQTITDSGTYTLMPLETSASALRVPWMVDSWRRQLYVYLEYRRAVGLDTQMSNRVVPGIVLHVGTDGIGANRSYKPMLLDAHPGTPAGWFDAAMQVGDVFSVNGYTLTVAGMTTENAVIVVTR